jgi:D-sedoheptulose 7-phosphate isomerase
MSVVDERAVARVVGDSASALSGLAASEEACRGIARLAAAVERSLRAGGTLWLFGNGGSAADAQHIAAEFVGRFRAERRPLPAAALTVNTSTLTAIANDYGFEEVFARQLRAQARAGDVALGISTSGRSANVVRGLEEATRLGVHPTGLTGGDGGDLARVAAECIAVQAPSTARIQECHLVIGHVLAELVEDALAEAGRA